MRVNKFNDLVRESETLRGQWHLTRHHALEYAARGREQEARFKGSLIAAEPDALVVSLSEKQSDRSTVSRLIKLTGTWKANAKNQLVFEVERARGQTDTLTFQAGWMLNDAHQIVYSLKRGTRRTWGTRGGDQELVLKGHWKFTEKNWLEYSLSADSESSFRFRGAFQTPSILAKAGEIRYQLGVEVAGRRKAQTITLFGKWKISRDLGLHFELEPGIGRRQTLAFGGEYNLDRSRQITVNLKSVEGRPLGVELILTRDFFNKDGGQDGQAFVRLQKTIEDSRVEAGIKMKW